MSCTCCAGACDASTSFRGSGLTATYAGEDGGGGRMNSAIAGAPVSWHLGSAHSWLQASSVPHACGHGGHGPK